MSTVYVIETHFGDGRWHTGGQKHVDEERARTHIARLRRVAPAQTFRLVRITTTIVDPAEGEPTP